MFAKFSGISISENLFLYLQNHFANTEVVENIKMKRPRGVGIEMPFCKILQNSKIVGWWRGRKIQLNSVAKVFYLAVIFCNVHTCTYGSEVSEYFDCLPPTVSSYMRCPARGIQINIWICSLTQCWECDFENNCRYYYSCVRDLLKIE